MTGRVDKAACSWTARAWAEDLCVIHGHSGWRREQLTELQRPHIEQIWTFGATQAAPDPQDVSSHAFFKETMHRGPCSSPAVGARGDLAAGAGSCPRPRRRQGGLDTHDRVKH